MNVNNLTFDQNRELYLSLREQYLSKRPMTQGEIKIMWSTWSYLTSNGFKWLRIKESQIRK